MATAGISLSRSWTAARLALSPGGAATSLPPAWTHVAIENDTSDEHAAHTAHTAGSAVASILLSRGEASAWMQGFDLASAVLLCSPHGGASGEAAGLAHVAPLMISLEAAVLPILKSTREAIARGDMIMARLGLSVRACISGPPPMEYVCSKCPQQVSHCASCATEMIDLLSLPACIPSSTDSAEGRVTSRQPLCTISSVDDAKAVLLAAKGALFATVRRWHALRVFRAAKCSACGAYNASRTDASFLAREGRRPLSQDALVASEGPPYVSLLATLCLEQQPLPAIALKQLVIADTLSSTRHGAKAGGRLGGSSTRALRRTTSCCSILSAYATPLLAHCSKLSACFPRIQYIGPTDPACPACTEVSAGSFCPPLLGHLAMHAAGCMSGVVAVASLDERDATAAGNTAVAAAAAAVSSWLLGNAQSERDRLYGVEIPGPLSVVFRRMPRVTAPGGGPDAWSSSELVVYSASMAAASVLHDARTHESAAAALETENAQAAAAVAATAAASVAALEQEKERERLAAAVAESEAAAAAAAAEKLRKSVMHGVRSAVGAKPATAAVFEPALAASSSLFVAFSRTPSQSPPRVASRRRTAGTTIASREPPTAVVDSRGRGNGRAVAVNAAVSTDVWQRLAVPPRRRATSAVRARTPPLELLEAPTAAGFVPALLPSAAAEPCDDADVDDIPAVAAAVAKAPPFERGTPAVVGPLAGAPLSSSFFQQGPIDYAHPGGDSSHSAPSIEVCGQTAFSQMLAQIGIETQARRSGVSGGGGGDAISNATAFAGSRNPAPPANPQFHQLPGPASGFAAPVSTVPAVEANHSAESSLSWRNFTASGEIPVRVSRVSLPVSRGGATRAPLSLFSESESQPSRSSSRRDCRVEGRETDLPRTRCAREFVADPFERPRTRSAAGEPRREEAGAGRDAGRSASRLTVHEPQAAESGLSRFQAAARAAAAAAAAQRAYSGKRGAVVLSVKPESSYGSAAPEASTAVASSSYGCVSLEGTRSAQPGEAAVQRAMADDAPDGQPFACLRLNQATAEEPPAIVDSDAALEAPFACTPPDFAHAVWTPYEASTHWQLQPLRGDVNAPPAPVPSASSPSKDRLENAAPGEKSPSQDRTLSWPVSPPLPAAADSPTAATAARSPPRTAARSEAAQLGRSTVLFTSPPSPQRLRLLSTTIAADHALPQRGQRQQREQQPVSLSTSPATPALARSHVRPQHLQQQQQQQKQQSVPYNVAASEGHGLQQQQLRSARLEGAVADLALLTAAIAREEHAAAQDLAPPSAVAEAAAAAEPPHHSAPNAAADDASIAESVAAWPLRLRTFPPGGDRQQQQSQQRRRDLPLNTPSKTADVAMSRSAELASGSRLASAVQTVTPVQALRQLMQELRVDPAQQQPHGSATELMAPSTTTAATASMTVFESTPIAMPAVWALRGQLEVAGSIGKVLPAAAMPSGTSTLRFPVDDKPNRTVASLRSTVPASVPASLSGSLLDFAQVIPSQLASTRRGPLSPSSSAAATGGGEDAALRSAPGALGMPPLPASLPPTPSLPVSVPNSLPGSPPGSAAPGRSRLPSQQVSGRRDSSVLSEDAGDRRSRAASFVASAAAAGQAAADEPAEGRHDRRDVNYQTAQGDDDNDAPLSCQGAWAAARPQQSLPSEERGGERASQQRHSPSESSSMRRRRAAEAAAAAAAAAAGMVLPHQLAPRLAELARQQGQQQQRRDDEELEEEDEEALQDGGAASAAAAASTAASTAAGSGAVTPTFVAGLFARAAAAAAPAATLPPDADPAFASPPLAATAARQGALQGSPSPPAGSGSDGARSRAFVLASALRESTAARAKAYVGQVRAAFGVD